MEKNQIKRTAWPWHLQVIVITKSFDRCVKYDIDEEPSLTMSYCFMHTSPNTKISRADKYMILEIIRYVQYENMELRTSRKYS